MYQAFTILSLLVAILAVSPTIRKWVAKLARLDPSEQLSWGIPSSLGLAQVAGAVVSVHGDHWHVGVALWFSATAVSVLLVPAVSVAVAAVVSSRFLSIYSAAHIVLAILTGALFLRAAFT